MADDIAVNPISLMPDSSQFDLAPGLHSLYGSSVAMDRQQQAKQFIDAQLQELPYKTATNIGTLQGQIERLPMENQKKKEALAQEYSQLRGRPARELIDASADLYPTIKDKSPPEQARAYESVKTQWKATHPGMPLPTDLDTFHPENTMEHLKTAHDMKRYGVEFEKEMAKEEEKTRAHLGGAAISAAGGMEQSRISAAGNLKVIQAQIDAGKFDNLPRYEIELDRALQTGKDAKGKTLTPEELAATRETLKKLKAKLVLEEVNKNPGVQSSSIMMMTGQPEHVQTYIEQRKKAMEESMRAHGLSPEDMGVPKGNKITVGGKEYDEVPSATVPQADKQKYPNAKRWVRDGNRIRPVD